MFMMIYICYDIQIEHTVWNATSPRGYSYVVLLIRSYARLRGGSVLSVLVRRNYICGGIFTHTRGLFYTPT